MDRRDKWESDYWRTGFAAVGTLSDELSDLVDAASSGRIASDLTSGVSEIFRMAKEIIFDVDAEGKITLTPMTWLLDAETFEYVLVGPFQAIFGADEEVKSRIVWALR